MLVQQYYCNIFVCVLLLLLLLLLRFIKGYVTCTSILTAFDGVSGVRGRAHVRHDVVVPPPLTRRGRGTCSPAQ